MIIKVSEPTTSKVNINVQDDSRVSPINVSHPGPQGIQGKSAYTLAVEEGFDGTLTEFLSQYDVNVNYHHTQDVPSTSWVITHNIGYKPNISLFDNEGNNIEGDISHSSDNQITVTFAIQISGTAILS